MRRATKIGLYVLGAIVGFMILSVLVAEFVPDSEPQKVSVKTIEPEAEAPKKKAPAPKPKVEKPKPEPKVEESGAFYDLTLTLNYDGYVFTLQNLCGRDRDWTNVEIEINAGLIASGYIMRVARIASGSTVTLRAKNFTKPDGLMFNPQTHRPNKVSVMCDVEGSTKKGWWIGQFGG